MKILTLCLSYILTICLLKIAFAPLYQFKPQVFDDLKVTISQLSYCESRNNPNAYVHNDGGSPSAGILQFKLATFYGQWKRLVNPDIELVDAHNLWLDSANQRNLAEKMLQENPKSIRNWYNCGKKLHLI